MNYIQDILKKKKVKVDDGADEKLDSFTDAQKAKFEKIFDEFDLDGSKRISHGEFRAVME